jgi:hypothetical protein
MTRQSNNVNDRENNPLYGETVNEREADVFGKLKNCYARFRACADARKEERGEVPNAECREVPG